MAQPEFVRDSRPIQESFSSLTHRLQSDVRELVNTETALAKRELTQKLDHLKNQTKGLVVASASMLLAGMGFTATVIAILSVWLPVWASAGLVTAALTVLSLVLFNKVDLKAEKMMPVNTINEVQRDLEAIKEAI